MIIVGLTNKGGNWINGEGWSGNGYHRILLPLATMEGITGFATDQLERNTPIDILLYNRVSQYDSNWDSVKEQLNCKVVLDMDDYWLPDYWGMAKRIENNIVKADLVIVTNDFLAGKVKSLNSNVVVIENGLPFGKIQFTEDKFSDDKIRIFWAGGLNHFRDLEMFKNAVNYKNRLLIHSDKIEMVMGGYNEQPDSIKLSDRMLSYFSMDGKLPNKAIAVLPATDYMTSYKYADIMVIPLEENNINKGKSILKVLEAASKKLPVIVSNVEPYSLYKDMPVLWVNSPKDWFKYLDYLIEEPDARVSLGNKLYEWAKDNFSLDKMNYKRLEEFNNLIKN